jgi:hypothetical protein
LARIARDDVGDKVSGRQKVVREQLGHSPVAHLVADLMLRLSAFYPPEFGLDGGG